MTADERAEAIQVAAVDLVSNLAAGRDLLVSSIRRPGGPVDDDAPSFGSGKVLSYRSLDEILEQALAILAAKTGASAQDLKDAFLAALTTEARKRSIPNMAPLTPTKTLSLSALLSHRGEGFIRQLAMTP